MSIVLRDCQKPQDIAMSSLILPRVSPRTGKLRKKTTTNKNQMSSLPDFISYSRHRHVRRFAFFFSSHLIGGCSRSSRQQRTGSQMQQLWREQSSKKLLFCLPELYVRNLFSISPTLEGQLIEHRLVMREVVSSTPAGPTLSVLK